MLDECLERGVMEKIESKKRLHPTAAQTEEIVIEQPKRKFSESDMFYVNKLCDKIEEKCIKSCEQDMQYWIDKRRDKMKNAVAEGGVFLMGGLISGIINTCTGGSTGKFFIASLACLSLGVLQSLRGGLHFVKLKKEENFVLDLADAWELGRGDPDFVEEFLNMNSLYPIEDPFPEYADNPVLDIVRVIGYDGKPCPCFSMQRYLQDKPVKAVNSDIQKTEEPELQ